MGLRRLLLIGLAIRLVIAPFFAHPFDMYVWYTNVQSLVSGSKPFWAFLNPYSYSYFLFVFPSTVLFDLLSRVLPSYTLQMSSLSPVLNPGSPWDIATVPGILFDLVVKLPLIFSDCLVAILIHRIARNRGGEKSGVSIAALWFLNPFTIWVSAGWGMFDTLPALFVVLALYCLLDRRFITASIALVVAVAMKYYAVVLIIPFLLLVFFVGGRRQLVRTFIHMVIVSALLFGPYFSRVAVGFENVIEAASPSGAHYSGLSFWSAITLFYSSFNQTLLSAILVSAALLVTYAWIWLHKKTGNSAQLATIAFCLPTTCLLLFYSDVTANLFVSIIPFFALLSLNDSWMSGGLLTLGIVALLSSLIDGLLPFFLLPMAPWIGSYLIEGLKIVNPYRVAPAGTVVTGISIGKVVLSLFGIAAFVLLFFLVVRTVIRYEASFAEGKEA